MCEVSDRISTNDPFVVVANENSIDQEEFRTQKEEEEGKQEEEAFITTVYVR